MIILEIVGWIGSFVYILSYFLLAYKFIEKGKLYYFLNKVAAVLIILVSYYKNTFQPIVINVIWLYISYLGYYCKTVEIRFINKLFLHITSTLFFFIFTLLLLFSTKELSFEVIAWFSVFAFSCSYFLFSTQKINEQTFHIYNFLAAVTLIPKMILYDNYQVVVLEFLWALFALIAYIKNSKNKNDYITLCS